MYNQLKLENQLCFPVYATSRLIIREYQPLLEKLGITYPQYLVLLVLWETDGLPVNDIAKKLLLNTNTVTPLLKRMESLELLDRKKSEIDERKTVVFLTEKGKFLEKKAAEIPELLVTKLSEGNLDLEDLQNLKISLDSVIKQLSDVVKY